MDLLLPPYVPWSGTSPFLSHPLVRHVLERAWYQGVPRDPPVQASTLLRIKSTLEAEMTPS